MTRCLQALHRVTSASCEGQALLSTEGESYVTLDVRR